MARRTWFYIIAPLILVWGLDRITKLWAESLINPQFLGHIIFVLHHNPGVIFGSFSDLPPLLRVVSLSTSGAFLIFCFIILQLLLPQKLILLRSGMSFLLGGILGNVFDRIAWGHITDFIVLQAFQYRSPVFNLADLFQWVGYFMMTYALLRDAQLLWPDKNDRKSYMINPRYQIKYSLKLASFALCFALLAGVLSYTFLKVTIDQLGLSLTTQGEHLLNTFIWTFTLMSIAFCCILFLVGFMLSHRAAGPIYAFERFLEGLYKGEVRPLKLRMGDEFLHLEQIAEKLEQKWSKSK